MTSGGCERRSVPGQPVRLVVGGNASSPAIVPHTLAQNLKLYEKEGVKAAVEIVPGGNKALQALLGGSADVVVGYYEHTIRMAARTGHTIVCQRRPHHIGIRLLLVALA